jgi:hypothetical protein
VPSVSGLVSGVLCTGELLVVDDFGVRIAAGEILVIFIGSHSKSPRVTDINKYIMANRHLYLLSHFGISLLRLEMIQQYQT